MKIKEISMLIGLSLCLTTISFLMIIDDNPIAVTVPKSSSWNLTPFTINDDGSGTYTWGEAVLQDWCTGQGTYDNPYVIEDVIIDATTSGHCLKIVDSQVFFTIRNCSFSNSGITYGGIELINVSNGYFFDNYFYNNYMGIFGELSKYNTIELNNFKSTDYISIKFDDNSNFNVIMSNDISNNFVGLQIVYGSNNSILGNTIHNNQLAAYFGYSNNNTFINNSINSCGNGVGFDNHCYDNLVSHNNLTNNDKGVWFHGNNKNNRIRYNNISSNSESGLYFESSDNNYNVFERNSISSNVLEGVYFVPNNLFNKFINNSFESNGIHVNDQSGGNFYNNSRIGNYWDNYTGYDFDDNGIGDIPHNISHSPLIQDFLPIWDDGDGPTPPSLLIESPNEGQIVGPISPEYKLTTSSIHIDTIWYNLNNSVNDTITSLTGKINQSVWEAIGEGNVNVRFYANDTLGNLNYTEITIEKDLTLPVITIFSPLENRSFGIQAPIYNISIFEKNLELVWYTIDNGLTNFTIANLTGTINQTIWDNTPSGLITIRFYAKDLAGNIGDSFIIVLKPPQERPIISGYNLLFLIGILGMTSILIIRKKESVGGYRKFSRGIEIVDN